MLSLRPTPPGYGLFLHDRKSVEVGLDLQPSRASYGEVIVLRGFGKSCEATAAAQSDLERFPRRFVEWSNPKANVVRRLSKF